MSPGQSRPTGLLRPFAQPSKIKLEASPEALCTALPAGVTQEDHHIKPYSITARVSDGDVINLGGRELEVLHIPGHTDDSIALIDVTAGLLWTGDTFYEGPIWLFFPETDLAAYETSLARLAALAPQLKALIGGDQFLSGCLDSLLAVRIGSLRQGGEQPG
jgi:glyoxylase-like metal-dependent hydrolase (beta-lactamase superfamily II)